MTTSTPRKVTLKARLKTWHAVVGLSQLRRDLARDLRTAAHLAKRRRIIGDYFAAHGARKLQIGAGNNPLDGWLNTDITPSSSQIIFMDATRRFPFDNDTFDYIASEHMIEHIEYAAGFAMLRECFRVLKPGGRLRIATPDLEVLLSLYSGRLSERQLRYIDWSLARFQPGVLDCKPVFVINHYFHSWGHQFLYDQATLCSALSLAGFAQMTPQRPGLSDDPALRNIESHGKEIESEDINDFETFVVEAVKS